MPSGTITIRPIGQRIIRYELMFVGDDGKTLRARRPEGHSLAVAVQDLHQLPAEILDEDHRRVGTCLTSFDLRHDGWSFAS